MSGRIDRPGLILNALAKLNIKPLLAVYQRLYPNMPIIKNDSMSELRG